MEVGVRAAATHHSFQEGQQQQLCCYQTKALLEEIKVMDKQGWCCQQIFYLLRRVVACQLCWRQQLLLL
jgi:hypothetical protein